MSDFTYEGLSISENRQQLIIDEWNSRPQSPPSLKEMVQLAVPHAEEKLQAGRSSTANVSRPFWLQEILRQNLLMNMLLLVKMYLSPTR